MQTVGQAAGKSQDDPEGCRHDVAVRDIHMLDVEGSCKSTTRQGESGRRRLMSSSAGCCWCRGVSCGHEARLSGGLIVAYAFGFGPSCCPDGVSISLFWRHVQPPPHGSRGHLIPALGEAKRNELGLLSACCPCSRTADGDLLGRVRPAPRGGAILGHGSDLPRPHERVLGRKARPSLALQRPTNRGTKDEAARERGWSLYQQCGRSGGVVDARVEPRLRGRRVDALGGHVPGWLRIADDLETIALVGR